MKFPNRLGKSLTIALTGATMSTAALLFLAGPLGIAAAVLGCAVCAYSLRYPLRPYESHAQRVQTGSSRQ
jgi:hypothetical protein